MKSIILLTVFLSLNSCFAQLLTVEKYNMIIRHRAPILPNLKKDLDNLDALFDNKVLLDTMVLQNVISYKPWTSDLVNYYGEFKCPSDQFNDYCLKYDHLRIYAEENLNLENDVKKLNLYLIPSGIGLIGIFIGVINFVSNLSVSEDMSDHIWFDNPIFGTTFSVLTITGFPILMIQATKRIQISFNLRKMIDYNNRYYILQHYNANLNKK